ncbi:lipopolysaccharide biosynthesis protein [Ochrobactrum chromiisoli]|uniref:Polysaccharide biosynthesis protein n=1 Tax=Ochrobactrum chromiisoli TaxID=2993941 RepID=A0ABT3QP38_9HYPH|nr:hypothetical protein [Ochrobactrum chromiisoli]MCX2697391.1 hypothetical protein [Ochrobactrum chromiisoli]
MSGLLKGSLFLTLAMLFSRGAVVLASALVARAFGAEAFALFTFVHLTATSLSNMAMLGMMKGLPRFCARMTVDASVDALTQVILAAGVVVVGLAMAMITVLVVPAEIIGLSEPAKKGVLAALILGIGLNNLLVGVSNGFERFGWVTISSFVLGIILIGGTLIAVLLDESQWPLRIYLLATCISLLILVPGGLGQIVRRYTKQGAVLNSSNIKVVWAYLGPMFLATTMTNTGLWLAGRSLIGGVGGGTAFAEFALGMQWFGLAQMASNIISRTVMPRLARNVWTRDIDDQHKTIKQAQLFSAFGAIAVLVGVLLLGPFLIGFYGTELAGSRWSLTLFVAAAIVAAPITVISSVLVAEARYHAVFWSTLVWWLLIVLIPMIVHITTSIQMVILVVVAYTIYLALLLVGRSHSMGAA